MPWPKKSGFVDVFFQVAFLMTFGSGPGCLGSQNQAFCKESIAEISFQRSWNPDDLKASPLPPAPLAVAGFMVAGLVAWQYSNRLVGLLSFAVWFCWLAQVLLVLSVGGFAGKLVSGCQGRARDNTESS